MTRRTCTTPAGGSLLMGCTRRRRIQRPPSVGDRRQPLQGRRRMRRSPRPPRQQTTPRPTARRVRRDAARQARQRVRAARANLAAHRGADYRADCRCFCAPDGEAAGRHMGATRSHHKGDLVMPRHSCTRKQGRYVSCCMRRQRLRSWAISTS